MAGLVDWDVAVTTARRLVRPGPDISLAEARAVTAQLRELVPIAERHVEEFTGLRLPAADIPVAVVDRVGWVRANVDGFRVALEPLVEKIAARRSGPGGGVVRAVGSKITGVEVGTIMAYLAARVLGQFELFLPPGEGDGRLTLVAPNIVETERRLRVDPDDFRLWVTLHEVTHRTQFTAVPWLRDYFTGQVRAYIDASDLDPSALLERLKAAAGGARDALAGKGEQSLIELVQTPEQRAILDRLQALMSLLEGHGDYVMDGVGPAVVPTAALIRARFSERRRGTGPVDRFVRRLLGLDLKMRQYAEGEAFVRRVVDAVGMEGFNRVFESPEMLPTLAEIRDPARWLARTAEVARPAGRDERP